MPNKVITFKCGDCPNNEETQITVHVPDINPNVPDKIQFVYCKRGHERKIKIPITWDVIRTTLDQKPHLTDADLPAFDSEPA